MWGAIPSSMVLTAYFLPHPSSASGGVGGGRGARPAVPQLTGPATSPGWLSDAAVKHCDEGHSLCFPLNLSESQRSVSAKQGPPVPPLSCR